MEVKNLQSWEEFENELHNLGLLKNRDGSLTGIVFRGQSDAKWKLKTTLERYVEPIGGLDKLHVLAYYNMIAKLKPRIESLTTRRWELLEGNEFMDKLRYPNTWTSQFLGLEYMIYLRHYGYPSPLLDWSQSPYVAAYFGFRDVTSYAESIAIYANTTISDNNTSETVIGAQMEMLGWDIKTDRRHFLQQSLYSICTIQRESSRYYCNHEEVLYSAKPNHYKLWKFILPSAERKRALKILDTYNINSYSLFQSEESILETALMRDYIGDTDNYYPG